MLNNFGGRLGLHGHLDNLANNIPKVFNETKYIAGIGILSLIHIFREQRWT